GGPARERAVGLPVAVGLPHQPPVCSLEVGAGYGGAPLSIRAASEGWSRCPESNWRPRPYQGRALPTELHRPSRLRRFGRQVGRSLFPRPPQEHSLACEPTVALRASVGKPQLADRPCDAWPGNRSSPLAFTRRAEVGA